MAEELSGDEALKYSLENLRRAVESMSSQEREAAFNFASNLIDFVLAQQKGPTVVVGGIGGKTQTIATCPRCRHQLTVTMQ